MCCVTLPLTGSAQCTEQLPWRGLCDSIKQPLLSNREELLKLHTTTTVILLRKRADNIVWENPDSTAVCAHQVSTIGRDWRRQCQDVNKLESQETNGIYLFELICCTLILNLQPFRPLQILADFYFLLYAKTEEVMWCRQTGQHSSKNLDALPFWHTASN